VAWSEERGLRLPTIRPYDVAIHIELMQQPQTTLYRWVQRYAPMMEKRFGSNGRLPDHSGALSVNDWTQPI
jgi:hypothetical protein